MGTHTGWGMMLTAIWQTQPDRPKLEKHTASSLATVSTSAQIASTMLVIVLTMLLLCTTSCTLVSTSQCWDQGLGSALPAILIAEATCWRSSGSVGGGALEVSALLGAVDLRTRK